jgi:hypothetical protein
MRFYWQMLTWRDVVGWTVAILVVAVFAFGLVYISANLTPNRGFATEWVCSSQPRAQICYKKPPSPGPTVVNNLPSE